MTIIAGYHAAPEGSAALRRAGEEAMLRRDSVLVVDISRPAHIDDSESLPAELETLRQSLGSAGLELSVEPPSPLDPDDALIQAAQLHQAELIVIGLRHRTPMGKMLLGSYSQKVLLKADCAVLAVKATDPTATTR
jgi:nucleotide-binding universal stress UspA family protein